MQTNMKVLLHLPCHFGGSKSRIMLTINIAREVLEYRSLTSFTYVQPMTLDISSAVCDNSNTFIIGYFLRGVATLSYTNTRVCVQLSIVLPYSTRVGQAYGQVFMAD